ncbi:MAG: alpha/beta fold hydrolase [Patescibacteria group bacterium]|nr:alpha/beta fold hydrolase [Patescibacteria group bacterium]MBU2509580.1 alpha/beta fold hydrolase [Patescibacteria group bacterium]
MEKITFKTSDDVPIVGSWVTAPTTFGAVILLHMMPTNKESWAKFQAILAKRGLASLAIDLRGHGESNIGQDGGKIDYKRFSDAEHQSSLFDVIGAFDWLKRREFETERIAVCGASIGANLAVQFLLEEPRVAGAALLSPGKAYHGINVIEDIVDVLPEQSVWIAASEGDDQASFDDSKAAFEAASSLKKEFVPLKNVGHGTKILEAKPELAESLADWLKEVVQGG